MQRNKKGVREIIIPSPRSGSETEIEEIVIGSPLSGPRDDDDVRTYDRRYDEIDWDIVMGNVEQKAAKSFLRRLKRKRKRKRNTTYVLEDDSLMPVEHTNGGRFFGTDTKTVVARGIVFEYDPREWRANKLANALLEELGRKDVRFGGRVVVRWKRGKLKTVERSTQTTMGKKRKTIEVSPIVVRGEATRKTRLEKTKIGEASKTKRRRRAYKFVEDETDRIRWQYTTHQKERSR